MKTLRVAFVWHMHQPPYTSPLTGEVRLPWVLLHAARDYYDFPRLVAEQPDLHMTFNYTPILLEQLRTYAEGRARDVHVDVARIPADELGERERRFLLDRFLLLPQATVLDRVPRLRKIAARVRDASPNGALLRAFGADDYRDVQTWFFLAWCGRTLRRQPLVRSLLEKQQGFSEEEKNALIDAVLEIPREILPLLRSERERGRNEFLASPFYHPILPLLSNQSVAERAHPGTTLPRQRFASPVDAGVQIHRGITYLEDVLGARPEGLWPPECAVSEAVLEVAAVSGVRHAVADQEVLRRSLEVAELASTDLYRPWRFGGVTVFFRDRVLSDQIGFVYPQRPVEDAVSDLVARLQRIRRDLQGRDKVVTIALDGENAWEFYVHGGYRFLDELFGRLAATSEIQTVTLAEAVAEIGPVEELPRLAPGSWIDGDFGTWIGAPQKNRAWELLADTRTAVSRHLFEMSHEATAEERMSVLDLVLRAEASDWFWWLGPPHTSRDDAEFEELFRAHLKACYDEMRCPSPPALDEPLEGAGGTPPPCAPPRGLVRPRITGRKDDYFEWIAAGQCVLTHGFTHRLEPVVQRVLFGNDEAMLYVRIDMTNPAELVLRTGWSVELVFRRPAALTFTLGRSDGPYVVTLAPARPSLTPIAAVGTVVEAALPLAAFGVPSEQWGRLPVEFFVRVREGGREHERFPAQDSIAFTLNAVDFDDENWFV